MKKTLTILTLLMLTLTPLALATVINPQPLNGTITNAANQDFTVDTTRASAYLNFGGILYEIIGGPGTVTLSAFLLPSDGNYNYNFLDIDGPTTSSVITVDRTNPTTTNFAFTATGNVVTYTPDCADLNLNAAATTAQFTTTTIPWTNFNSGDNLNTLYGATGPTTFRGTCQDLASNTKQSTTQPTINLPAVPATLNRVDIETPTYTPNAGTTFTLTGAGTPLLASIRIVYSELTSLTSISVNGGPTATDPAQTTDHILTFSGLTTGNYIVSITAQDIDGNPTTSTITMNVANADGSGNVSISVLGTIQVPTSQLTITGTQVIKGAVQAGDFALVRYSLSMVNASYIRTIFDNAGTAPFTTNPIVAFCGENYDSVLRDIETPLNPARNVENPVPNNWLTAELQPALNCADTDGIVNDVYTYDVYAKIPIDLGTLPGTYGGSLTFGLYTTP